jgi:hypothetical protein
MYAPLESIVEMSLAAASRQNLRLDHVFGTGEFSRDPGRLLLVGRHTKLLHRHTIVLSVTIRDAPDIRLIQKPDTGYPAGYPVKAGYRISGRIFILTNIFLVRYKIIFF